MAAQEPNTSDSFWFLEKDESDLEVKRNGNNVSKTDLSQGQSELEKWREEFPDILKTNTNEQTQMETQRSVRNNAESFTENDETVESKDAILDLDELKNELQGLYEDSSAKEVSTDLNNSPSDITAQRTSQDKSDDKTQATVKITLSNENEGFVINENDIKINTEDSSTSQKQPKIYVLLKSDKDSEGSNKVNCTEVGSTVINLNDLFSPEKKVNGNENISTSVNYSTNNLTADGKPQVELVITIKDEREKSPESSTPKVREIPIQLEENKLKDISDKNRYSLQDSFEQKLKDIAEKTSSFSSSTVTSWQSSGNKVDRQTEGDWSTESRDSWVRESDGARCYRTVVTGPLGKKVETKCVKEGRPRYNRQRRDQRLSSSLFSFADDLDVELYRLFNTMSRSFSNVW